MGPTRRPLLRRYTDRQLAQETAFLAHPAPEQPEAGPSPGRGCSDAGNRSRSRGVRGREGERGGKLQGMEVGKRELPGRRQETVRSVGLDRLEMKLRKSIQWLLGVNMEISRLTSSPSCCKKIVKSDSDAKLNFKSDSDENSIRSTL
jgi:hypothetical protein